VCVFVRSSLCLGFHCTVHALSRGHPHLCIGFWFMVNRIFSYIYSFFSGDEFYLLCRANFVLSHLNTVPAMSRGLSHLYIGFWFMINIIFSYNIFFFFRWPMMNLNCCAEPTLFISPQQSSVSLFLGSKETLCPCKSGSGLWVIYFFQVGTYNIFFRYFFFSEGQWI